MVVNKSKNTLLLFPVMLNVCMLNTSPVGYSQLSLDLVKIAVASLQPEISLKSVNEHSFCSIFFYFRFFLDKKQSVSEHPM